MSCKRGRYIIMVDHPMQWLICSQFFLSEFGALISNLTILCFTALLLSFSIVYSKLLYQITFMATFIFCSIKSIRFTFVFTEYHVNIKNKLVFHINNLVDWIKRLFTYMSAGVWYLFIRYYRAAIAVATKERRGRGRGCSIWKRASLKFWIP